jgi:hypothetical protein
VGKGTIVEANYVGIAGRRLELLLTYNQPGFSAGPISNMPELPFKQVPLAAAWVFDHARQEADQPRTINVRGNSPCCARRNQRLARGFIKMSDSIRNLNEET